MRLNLHKLDQEEKPYRKTSRYPLLRLKSKRPPPAKNADRRSGVRRPDPSASTE